MTGSQLPQQPSTLGEQWKQLRTWRRDVDLVESLNEQVTVLAHAKNVDLRTENLDTETVKDTHLVELDTDIEGTLTTKVSKTPSGRSFSRT